MQLIVFNDALNTFLSAVDGDVIIHILDSALLWDKKYFIIEAVYMVWK